MRSMTSTGTTVTAFGPVELTRSISFGWIVLGLFLLALLFALACFTGLLGSDDLVYSGFAQRFADGKYPLEYHYYAIRFGVIVPVGLIYAVFGVSEWSTIAVPLVASSCSVVLLALIGIRLLGMRTGLVAALLLATFPLHLHDATSLFPEPIAQCYLLLALLAYVWAGDETTWRQSILAGALVGLAYLTKEPAVFVGPALFLDAALRRRWRRAFGVALGLAAVIGLEHAYYLAATGDLMFRPHAMAMHNMYVTGNKGQIDANFVLSYRLIKQYPEMMLEPNLDFGIHSLAALALSALALLRFRKDRRIYLLLLWASVPWLYLNFGTSSFSHYIPIPVMARYIVFTYPPLFLMAAWLLTDLSSRFVWGKLATGLALTAILSVGFTCAMAQRGTGYRTNHMAVLRVIADRVVHKKIDGVCFDIPPDTGLKSRWPRAMYILSGGYVPICEGTSGRLTIRTDPMGFPYIATAEP